MSRDQTNTLPSGVIYNLDQEKLVCPDIPSGGSSLQWMLGDFAQKSFSEQGGANAQRGFSFQATCAIQILIDIHDTGKDYVMIVDHQDDIVVLTNDSRHFYQVKTKKSGTYTWKEMLTLDGGHSHSSKMYCNSLKFPDSLTQCTLISNVAFKVRLKLSSRTQETESFQLNDLTKNDVIAFYEHVHEVNRAEIERIQSSTLVGQSFKYRQSHYNLHTHIDAMESRFSNWLDRKGYSSYIDNRWLYKQLRAEIEKRAQSVIGKTTSVETKQIPKERIEALLHNHDKIGMRHLIDAVVEVVNKSFPYAYQFEAQQVAVQYLATDCYNPNNETPKLLRARIPALISAALNSNPLINSDKELVEAIDPHLDVPIRRQYPNQSERAIIILVEIIRAKKTIKHQTPRAQPQEAES